MKCLKQPFYNQDGGMFMTAQEAIDDPVISPVHGRQNKHGGTAYKRKRKTIKLARRRNRGVKQK
jgi:hypothetical protein